LPLSFSISLRLELTFIRIIYFSYIRQSRVVRRCYFKKNSICDFELSNRSLYFREIARIASPSYRPTRDDILAVAVDEPATPHVSRELVHTEGMMLEVFTARGFYPRVPRWFHCFEHAEAAAFVCPLSESEVCNRSEELCTPGTVMYESADFFNSVCPRQVFDSAPFLLFLSRPDRVVQDILNVGAGRDPPPSKDPRRIADSEGRSINPRDLRRLLRRLRRPTLDAGFGDSFVHVTSSKTTTTPKFILDSIRTIMMVENLRRSGFLGTTDGVGEFEHSAQMMDAVSESSSFGIDECVVDMTSETSEVSFDGLFVAQPEPIRSS